MKFGPTLANRISDQWKRPESTDFTEVRNPATAEILARVPASGKKEVAAAVESAARAFREWRRIPAVQRVQYLYRLKALLEKNSLELARLVSQECGKTLSEARGEIARGIENVEVACGIPTLMQGTTLEDAARGIDESMIRQPVGVVAAVTPFNFPAMIPLWFLPYAIACGNTFILKPSEKTPLTAQKIFELMEGLDLPAGVVNLVHGTRETVDALVEHPDVKALSFVGSTPVARHLYGRAAATGKRVQCQGGAKNPVVILPDADIEAAVRVVGESAFGCAGQRCLASSVAVTVGSTRKEFSEAVTDLAGSLRVGSGLEEGVQMGPLISEESKLRVESLIAQGARDGGQVRRDGRALRIPRYERGYFVGPTVLEQEPTREDLFSTEVFGPVLSLVPAATLDEAIELISRSPYGNAASIFTRDGAAARRFRYEVPAGNIGVNIGVAAAMAFFPFAGMKQSFWGDLHAQGRDAIDFYTEKKVVIERWGR